MSGRRVDIDRVGIVLHGVSAELAESAAAGLEGALRRRLGALHVSRSLDVPALRIDALDLPPQADASVLRDLLAERLVQAIAAVLPGTVAREEDA